MASKPPDPTFFSMGLKFKGHLNIPSNIEEMKTKERKYHHIGEIRKLSLEIIGNENYGIALVTVMWENGIQI